MAAHEEESGLKADAVALQRQILVVVL